MRYARGHKAETRARILDVASRRLGEKGFRASGVDGVMEAAGLTAGAFYSHFESKDALLLEALCQSLESGRSRLFAGLEGLQGIERLRALAGRYLSRAHRDAPASGCPLPALAGELAREGPPPRRALETYVRQLADDLAAGTPPLPGLTPQDRVLATIALLSGALTLSRAVEDTALSDRILLAARRMAVPEAAAEPARPEGRKPAGRKKRS